MFQRKLIPWLKNQSVVCKKMNLVNQLDCGEAVKVKGKLIQLRKDKTIIF